MSCRTVGYVARWPDSHGQDLVFWTRDRPGECPGACECRLKGCQPCHCHFPPRWSQEMILDRTYTFLDYVRRVAQRVATPADWGCHVGLWGVTWIIDPINSCLASILPHLNLGSERIWPQLDFGFSFNHLLISWLRPVIVKSSCIFAVCWQLSMFGSAFLGQTHPVISRQLVWLRFSFGLSWSKQNLCIPTWNWPHWALLPMFVCAGFLNSLGLSICSTALFFFLFVKMHCIYGKFNSKPFS